jgi:mRNA interferase MazF
MEKLSIRDVIFIKFPFSDLSNAKLRPALIVGLSDNNDYILCQITSKNYGSANPLKLQIDSFESGGLIIDSFVRVNKIFTANINIINKKVATITKTKHIEVIQRIINILHNKTDV